MLTPARYPPIVRIGQSRPNGLWAAAEDGMTGETEQGSPGWVHSVPIEVGMPAEGAIRACNPPRRCAKRFVDWNTL